MPSDDVILNLKQIAGYPPSGVQPFDLIVAQRGGLGGPYVQYDAAELVSGALVSSAAALQVGIGAPADADGSQVFLGGVCSNWDAAWIWNAYAGSVPKQEFNFLTNGPAAILQCDPAAGWRFFWMQSTGGPGQPAAITSEPLSISPDGYLTVADQVHLARNPQLPLEAATAQWVTEQIIGSTNILMSLYNTATVWSFNNRTGQVILNLCDVMGAGGAPIFSPVFQGQPTVPTPEPASNDTTIANTQWVWQSISHAVETGAVASFNGRTGAVELTNADITAAGGLSNPSAALTGVPTAPTAAPLANSTQIATTAYVDGAITNMDLSHFAPLNSPNFTGQPTAPTVPPGANDGRLATTAFVHAAVVAATSGVSSFNSRTGAVVLSGADITGAGGALLTSPVFTGTPTGPTAAPGNNTQQLATTAYVMAALTSGSNVTSFNGRSGVVTLTTADITGAGGAPSVSPALTGTPTAPTATSGTSTTQIATTAFVANAIAAQGTMVNSFNGRSGAVTLAANDISAAGGAVLASPSFSGVPTAPTASPGTNTSQIATTSFVTAAIAAGGGVASFNGRTGAITLQGTDVSGAGGALLVSPTFSGTPSGPTATVGTSNTQLATTAFVQAAIAATPGVTSFNSRTGAVTLTTADITGAGGAVLASPSFTGNPTGPTPAPGDNTTALATTAFVQQAINSIGAGVVSFNGRTGAVSLLAADISAAGGLSNPSAALTGAPTAPTAAPGTNTTQIATTAYVHAGYLPISGGTVTGKLGISLAIPADADPALVEYVAGDMAMASNNFGLNTYHMTGNTWRAVGANGAFVFSCTVNSLILSSFANSAANTTYPLANTHVFSANGDFQATRNLIANGTVSGAAANFTGGLTATAANFGGGNAVAGSFTCNAGNQSALLPNGLSFSGATAFAAYYNASTVVLTGVSGGTVFGDILVSNGLGAYTVLNNLVLAGSSNACLAYYGTGNNYVLWTISFASDRQLKRNLELSGRDALAAIASVPIYSCDMTQPVPGASEQHWDWSVVADELEAIIPLAVTPPLVADGYATIKELPIVVALMKAVQQLLTRVETLEARLAA